MGVKELSYVIVIIIIIKLCLLSYYITNFGNFVYAKILFFWKAHHIKSGSSSTPLTLNPIVPICQH